MLQLDIVLSGFVMSADRVFGFHLRVLVRWARGEPGRARTSQTFIVQRAEDPYHQSGILWRGKSGMTLRRPPTSGAGR